MHLTRLGNVMLAVKDLDKSVEFYHNVIGLPIKTQRKTMGGSWHYWCTH